VRLMWGAAHHVEEAEHEEGSGSHAGKAEAAELVSGGFHAELTALGLPTVRNQRETSPLPVPPYSDSGIVSP
jgi:hypothetical protein